jgi:predicted enzyme related to lactoylglutathione lyase
MRDGYPHGVPCFIDTEQPDRQAAADFYRGVFGWEFEDRGGYLMGRLEGSDVAGVGAQLTHAAAAWHTYVCVDSADDAAARVRAAGGSVLRGPQDFAAAGRLAVFSDPAGAVFRVWEAREHRGAQLVNAPGTWNWSNLSTRDTDGAKAFYAAVFGWEAQTVDFGLGESTMWRLPGYGDVLEQAEPGLRERQAEAGAPPGFEDAVAWLLPLNGNGISRWSVTFTAANTDAVAARAADLGGTVLVAPYDAGPVRAADLRDPQGATFSVNSFDPV